MSLASRAQLLSPPKPPREDALILTPPLPWRPLAPLRQLLDHAGRTLPAWEPCDLSISSFWLGPHVALSRRALRIAQELQETPLQAWIGPADLHAVQWGSFLRLAQQGQLHAPLTFLFLQEEPEALPTYAGRYLSQALLFGPKLEPSKLKKLSRANHIRRRSDLRHFGLVMGPDDAFEPRSLRRYQRGPLPDGTAWRKRALKLCEDPTLESWLRYAQRPVIPGDRPMSQERAARSLLELEEPELGPAIAALASEHAEDGARLTAWLGSLRHPDASREALDPTELATPYRQLLQCRQAAHLQSEDAIPTLNRCLQELMSSGPKWAAGLVAVDLARWHLSQGRLQQIFGLLKPYLAVEDWALRWRIGLLQAQAFGRMGRWELARGALERASDAAPKPLSPMLTGELRLASARQLAESRDAEAAEAQLNAARDAFLAAGDGVRLGQYYLLAGLLRWRRRRWEEARNLFVKALDLFRRFHDGLGIREAQLKLGLVLREAGPDVVGE